MTDVTTEAPVPGARIPAERGTSTRLAANVLDVFVRSIVPVLLALVAGAILLLALGRNPLTFYGDIWKGGIELGAWQDSLMRAAPLLLIAIGLTVVFRANIWNLGYDGQFLLGAALISGLGPWIVTREPLWFALTVLFLVAGAAGAAWTIVPAALKAYYGTNEIITTLMMSFIGVGVANILIKGPFQDPTVNIPETRVLPLDKMLPSIPGTRVHVGVLVAFAAVIVVHFVLTRTSFGLRLQVLGANPRAARHMGVKLPRVIVMSFLVSGFLIGMAAAADILGIWGYVRSNWNPAYGDTVIPFVFLARLNVLALVPYVLFYAVLSTGGDLATEHANLTTDFLLVLVALILIFMTLIEYFGRRRALGTSYLTPGLRQSLRVPWRTTSKAAAE
ncbi:MAG TPA: ABC transporter permease [Gaiellaceae bacterium]|jgi:simple sugar transport system permease protein|nr:ABC transporter permease [Gaiellaceae bacterium]